MTIVAATGISAKVHEDFVEAQKADPILANLKELSTANLTRYGMQISSQGILYKVVDNE